MNLEDVKPRWMEDGLWIEGRQPNNERSQLSGGTPVTTFPQAEITFPPYTPTIGTQPSSAGYSADLYPWMYPDYAAFPTANGDPSTSAELFVGYDDTAGEYKFTLTDGTNGMGLHAGYLEIDDGDVFLGLGSDSTKHLEIATATAYVKMGDTGQAFVGFDGAIWTLNLNDDSAAVQLGASNQVQLGSISGTWQLLVGATSVKDGNIDLGPTGTVTINSKIYQPTQIQDCNGKLLWILADAAGWM